MLLQIRLEECLLFVFDLWHFSNLVTLRDYAVDSTTVRKVDRLFWQWADKTRQSVLDELREGACQPEYWRACDQNAKNHQAFSYLKL